MTAFNLAAMPWIPVRTSGGTDKRVSLRDALVDAHTFTGIEHPIPIIEAGVWRLLVAVALDAFQPRALGDLSALLGCGRFETGIVDKYLDKYRDRFDLFSPTRPFLQDPAVGGAEKPVAALLPSQPSGTNATHWHHGREVDFAISPAEAACLLTTVAPFMTAGGAGLSPSLNGAPPWYVMPIGRSLFESIVLNIWVTHHSDIQRGVPAWRRSTPIDTTTRRTSTALLEAYTWLPRRIRFIPGDGGQCSLTGDFTPVLVRRMYFAAGESCDFQWYDPNVAYTVVKEKVRPVRPKEDRAPWRDVGVLALLEEQTETTNDKSRIRLRPAIVSQFAALSEEDPNLVRRPLELRLYGMRTDLKMKVFEWYRQSLDLPVSLVLRSTLHLRLVRAVDDAEQVQRALRHALMRAVTIAGRAPNGESEMLVRRASIAFWSTLEEPFRALAFDLGALEPERQAAEIDAVVAAWREGVARTARSAFGDVTRGLRLDAARLIAIERARAALDLALRKLGPDDPAGPGRPPRKGTRSASRDIPPSLGEIS